jgi:hypothetical protein
MQIQCIGINVGSVGFLQCLCQVLLEIGLSVVDWFGLAQDRYRWRVLVSEVMDLWVP